MRYTFADLERLLDTNPTRYRHEVERLRLQDPERFKAFVEYVRRQLEREDRPASRKEVDELAKQVAERLGWSVNRTMAEALLRLLASLDSPGPAKTYTPEEPKHRRFASAEALILSSLRARR